MAASERTGGERTAGERTVWRPAYRREELEEVPCPLCGGTQAEERARQFGLRVVQCGRCGLQYVSPRVREPEKNYWSDPTLTASKYAAIFESGRPHPRDANYREHLGTLNAFRGGGRLLDVGTHCGFFLRRAREAGWDVLGVEPSPTNATLARQKFGLPVINDYLHGAGLPNAAFDVVTLVDVLEHVTDPTRLLHEVHRVLRPQGVVFIKVPNAPWNLMKYAILGIVLHRWDYDFFDIREHVVQYTQTSLSRLLTTCGFDRMWWYVPRPVQSGSRWRWWAREVSYRVARVYFALTRHIPALATDIAVVAAKESHDHGQEGIPPRTHGAN